MRRPSFLRIRTEPRSRHCNTTAVLQRRAKAQAAKARGPLQSWLQIYCTAALSFAILLVQLVRTSGRFSGQGRIRLVYQRYEKPEK